MDLPIGDENGARIAFRRNAGEGLIQGGEGQCTVIGTTAGWDDGGAQFGGGKFRGGGFDGLLRFGGEFGAIAQLLALALIDKQHGDIGQRLTFLIAYDGIEQGQRESGKGERAQ